MIWMEPARHNNKGKSMKSDNIFFDPDSSQKSHLFSDEENQINGWQSFTKKKGWRPPTDVYETESEIIVKVEIAGLDTDQFDITFNNNVLSINGNRSDDVVGKKAFHQMEIGFGDFSTSIEIKTPINLDSASAQYTLGFLIITLPKSLPKFIKIQPR
ncbi:MAG: hypothetical protein CVU39_02845 [Chloroflexi bacterium HGW-Chloroflexi-10]|nr:MAG: hypothetical protein CVU39_02845 [Chloroflexi bacterium HGW-Chloroflexi-10]